MISRDYIAIEDLVDTIIDNRGKTVPIIDGSGIPLIATNCIKFSSIYPVFENIRYISQDTYDTWFRAHLQPNDILFVNKGTPGRCCITPDPVNFVGAQDMVGLRFRKEYHPFYMLAVIRSKEVQETIQNNHVGLVIAHFRKQELVKLKLPILDIKIRDYIGEVYKNISYKIELNNKINVELEAMAKTLFDYWFVQFDFPDVYGKPCKSSGGKMVWNEELKREIPEGWKTATLDSIGNIIGGSTPSKAVDENFCNGNGTPWITPKDLSNNKGKKFITRGEYDVTELGLKEASLKLMPAGTVLLSSRAPIGYLAIARQNVTTNQGFKSFVPVKGYSSEYIYFTVQNHIPEIEANSSGSTFKEVSSSTLKTIKTILPSDQVLSAFNEKIKPIFKKQDCIELENQELTSLRDWLLPMLMNGQVTVGGYEVEGKELDMVAEQPEIYPKEVKKTAKKVKASPIKLNPLDVYKRTLLAAEIVFQLKETFTLGHLKLQKMLYLCQEIENMALPMNFLKQAMGPYDNQLARSLDKQFETKKWFKYQREASLKYQPLEKCGQHRDDFDKYFENQLEGLNYLINKFSKFTSTQIEAVATLYACWKEAIENNELLNDKLIITKFYNWSKEKEKFQEDNLVKALTWMRNNGIYPK